MSYLGIRKAIFARLLGDEAATRLDAPDASRGMKYGVDDPRRPNTIGPKPIDHFGIPGCYHSVPVFPHNLSGTGSSTWPAVGIYLRYIKPRLEGGAPGEQLFSPESDIRMTPVAGSEETITFMDGTSVNRASLVEVRKPPRAWDYRFDIRVDSQDEAECAIIGEHILNLLGPVSYLSVDLRSGCKASYDTYIDEPQFMDIPIGTLEGPQVAEYSMIIPLIIEGFEDNTMAFTIRRLISRRALTLSDMFRNPVPEGRVEQGTPGYQICLLDKQDQDPPYLWSDVIGFGILMSGDQAGNLVGFSGDQAGFFEGLSGDQLA